MKFVALLLLSTALLSGCASGEDETVEAAPVDLQTYEGLSAALTGSAGVLLYDVRTAEEYAAGHIPGAINIPYGGINKWRGALVTGRSPG